mgnify:CR=1 FL=1
MRICVISTPTFALGQQGLTGYGGLEQIAWQQAKGLAEKGHQVALVAPDGSSCPGVMMIHCGPAGMVSEEQTYGGTPGAQQLPDGRVVRKIDGYWPHLLQADCVIDHSWNKFSMLLKLEGRLQVPSLLWSHAPVDTMYRQMPDMAKPCFVCISEDQGAHFRALFGRDCRVCHNGIDLDTYKPLGLPRSKRFLFLARFSTVKSPDVCIDACKQAGAELDLIGDTKLTGEPEFLQSIIRMGDGKRIMFVGPAMRGETVWWYSQARGFLHLNNRFREPFGLAPVEAQACGNGVLCWDYGAMKETVKHGESGFLVKSVEEAVQLLVVGAVDKIDRKRCREWASQFSLQRMVNRVEELCKEAVDGGGW